MSYSNKSTNVVSFAPKNKSYKNSRPFTFKKKNTNTKPILKRNDRNRYIKQKHLSFKRLTFDQQEQIERVYQRQDCKQEMYETYLDECMLHAGIGLKSNDYEDTLQEDMADVGIDFCFNTKDKEVDDFLYEIMFCNL
jgi:hypothetical protein